jgi:ABC-type transporter Mla subunit MlaD
MGIMKSLGHVKGKAFFNFYNKRVSWVVFLENLFCSVMMIFPMRELFGSSGMARRVGLVVGCGILLLAALIFFGTRYEWFAGRYLLLTTLDDLGGLKVSSPVYYQGVEIGRVAWIREPDEGSPGFKIRMRIGRRAFRQIALDARVRVDVARRTKIPYVTILPGRGKPERFFPGKVKVLEPVSRGEEWFRIIHDVLEGLEDLSEARIEEAEVEELKDEVDRLQKRIEELEDKGNGRED